MEIRIADTFKDSLEKLTDIKLRPLISNEPHISKCLKKYAGNEIGHRRNELHFAFSGSRTS